MNQHIHSLVTFSGRSAFVDSIIYDNLDVDYAGTPLIFSIFGSQTAVTAIYGALLTGKTVTATHFPTKQDFDDFNYQVSSDVMLRIPIEERSGYKRLLRHIEGTPAYHLTAFADSITNKDMRERARFSFAMKPKNVPYTVEELAQKHLRALDARVHIPLNEGWALPVWHHRTRIQNDDETPLIQELSHLGAPIQAYTCLVDEPALTEFIQHGIRTGNLN